MNLSFNLTDGRVFSMDKDALKKFRESIGLTQSGLADALSVANNTVSRWELGTRAIPSFLPLALETIERNQKARNAPAVVSRLRKVADGMLLFSDVCIRLNKSESSVRRYLTDKRLKGEKVKGEWQILESDVEEFERSEFFQSLK
jgi:transcriptional regulator with XRE-family HTH domain